MASNPQGYDEERFATTVNRNFICSICFNVLRNPVECPRNQHCFCRDCITKYLQNSQKCPTCADELTEDTLTEPSRIAKDYLNELNIHCKYVNKGCHEIVQLQHLDRHEAACGFTPVVCTNQGCGVTVNKRDQIRHESELCEFRKLKCHSCGEMTKTLADIEKRMANMEKDMATNKTTMATQLANMEKMKKKFEKMENMAINVEKNMADMKTDMEGRLEAVNNEVTGLKAALIEGFNEMKEVLGKIEDTREKRTRDVRGGASGDKEKENTIVVGGLGIDSVEIFNWPRQTWSPLHALPDKRYGGTSFVYNNHVTIAGGYCSGPGYVDNMIKLNIDPNTDVSAHWIKCPVKIPAKLAYHSSVLYNNHLIVTGGYNKSLDDMSECIDEVQLAPPYTTKTLSKMPEPRHGHITEIMDDKIFIVGGRTAFLYTNSLSSVLLYDIKKNQCKQMAPLPYEVSYMASESWGDNIVVIGGIDKQGQALDTVIMYNVKTEQHRMLPSMRCKRYGCTAVLTGNNIIVMGGMDKQGRYLTSVEAFNFDRYTWEDLPEMSKGRYLHNAVAV